MSEIIHFLLLPGFSAMGFISALEPLRVANRFRGPLYRWRVLSLDGGAVQASNGMSVNADGVLGRGGGAHAADRGRLRTTGLLWRAIAPSAAPSGP